MPTLPPPLVPHLNFFMPAMKFESRVKAVSKEIKKYDALRNLCQSTFWNRRPCRLR
jgi:hypothetical protein